MATAALLAGIIVVVKDKDGNTIARLFGPEDAIVEVTVDRGNGGESGTGSGPGTQSQSRPSTVRVVKNGDSDIPLAMVQYPPALTGSDGQAVEFFNRVRVLRLQSIRL